MTTKKQIASLLDHLSRRNADILVTDCFAIVSPLRHIKRAIWIDRSWDADYPRFFWAIGHTFNPMISLRSIWAEQFHLARGAADRWSQPGFQDSFLHTLEVDILPMLRRVETLDDMLHLGEVPRSCAYDGWLQDDQYQMHFLAANGRFGEAITIYNRIKNYDRSERNLDRRALAFVVDELAPLILAGDRAGVAALLHRWERTYVETTGLSAIYESTPFPLELQPTEPRSVNSPSARSRSRWDRP